MLRQLICGQVVLGILSRVLWHLIDDNWQLKTFCLDTVPVLDDQTGQYLADAVQDILRN